MLSEAKDQLVACETWNWYITQKLKCFIWLALGNRIQTRDVLMRKGFYGLSVCILCLKDSKSASHLFFKCVYSRSLWFDVLGALKIRATDPIEPLGQYLLWWEQNMGIFKSLPIFMTWGIWKVRNKLIFEGRPKESSSILG